MRVLVAGVVVLGACVFLCAGCGGGGGAAIKSGQQIDTSNFRPIDFLCAAAVEGNLSEVKNALAADPSLINVRGDRGRTPLHFAAGGGHKEVVKYLLEQGADPLAEDENGDPASGAALEGSFTDIAQMISEAAAAQMGAAPPAPTQ